MTANNTAGSSPTWYDLGSPNWELETRHFRAIFKSDGDSMPELFNGGVQRTMTSPPNQAPNKVRSVRGVGCLAVAFVGLAILAFIGVSFVGLVGGSGLGDGRVLEVAEVLDAKAQKKLVIIEVKGVLIEDSSVVHGSGVAGYTERMLERARTDDSVAGVLLLLDTPGGSVTTSDILHDLVLRVRKAGKPVVVLMGDVCASGGYYIAAGADSIFAHPTSLTGSIGVLINALSAQSLMERYGLVDQSIVSGPNKQILSVTQTLTPEQRSLLQNIVNELYNRFVKVIVQGRKLDVNAVKAVADGRVVTATQAKAAGLIDTIGYQRDALAHLKTKAGQGPFNIVRYRQQPSVWSLMGAQLSRSTGLRDVPARLSKLPRAYYLYGGLGVATGVQNQ